MRLLVSLICGALFGGGLVLSGMTDTLKVQGFLDLFGAWDPTLVFVMGGAIVPMFFAWRMAMARERALLGTPMPDAPHSGIDGRLATGAVLFGAGWGLAGFCPGPALASLGFGGWPVAVFVVSMVAGMLIARPVMTRFSAA